MGHDNKQPKPIVLTVTTTPKPMAHFFLLKFIYLKDLKTPMKPIMLFLIFVLSSLCVCAYDNIEEYDMNEDIIFSTSVYDTDGSSCTNCVCNLTVYNTHPNENIIKLKVSLNNYGNGIYSANLSKNLTYSKHIYPIKLICANTNQYLGSDERVGIKVGENMFDYSAIIIGLLAVCGLLIFASFQLDKKFWDIKLFLFFSSFIFMIASVFVGLQVVKTTTIASDLTIVFDIMFYVILAVTMIVIYFYAKHKIVDALDMSKQK